MSSGFAFLGHDKESVEVPFLCVMSKDAVFFALRLAIA
jgi:hypothetical protein